MMDRRVFVTLIAGTCLLEPFAVRAQQSGKVLRLDCSFRGPNRKVRTRSLWSLFGRVCAILAGWKAGTRDRNPLGGAIPQRQRELAAELKALPVR